MSRTDLVLGVETDFIKVLEALSFEECRHNRRLRDKTKKVAEILAKVAEVRKDLARKAAEAAQAEGNLS